MAQLRVEFRGARTTIALARAETTVGRSNRCTVHLPDPTLAEIHFRIRAGERGYRLKDDGSGSGTRVNGKPVFATALSHGDVIEAGALRCVFLVREEAPAPPPARAPVERPARRPPASRGTHRSQVLAVAVGGVVVLVAVLALLMQGSPERDAQERYRLAQAALDAAAAAPARAEERFREALEHLRVIGQEFAETKVASLAAVTRREVEQALDALASVDREAKLLDGVTDETAEQLAFARLARLKKGAHVAVVLRVERLADDLKQRRRQAHEEVFAGASREAEALLADKRFAEALRVWRELEIGDYFLRRRADDALRDTEHRVGEEYRNLLRLAGRDEELDARIALLEANRSVFQGTRHAEDLEVRIGALRARRIEATTRPPTAPTPQPGTTEPTPPVVPEEAGPYADPPTVAALAASRRYGEAARQLTALSGHPLARVRLEELTQLANLMADLVAAIAATPADFTLVLLPQGKGRGDAVGADGDGLAVRKDGETLTIPWAELPARAFERLFRSAGFDRPPRLATALFLDEEGLADEATKAYVAFFRSEQDTPALTRILARRRGIEPPAGGFVLFRGELLTPPEQERILLLERIALLGREGRSTIEARRQAAWAELESLGEPAAETLALVLTERRQLVADELKASRAFTPARFVARFGRDLQDRREEALAFIRDEAKYPYPNKSDAAQAEAERLVDRVREIYERPFEALLDASEDAQALRSELLALDERIARADPLAVPLFETVVEEITRRLDTRTIAVDDRDRKRIEYNVAVGKYNRELKNTSADDEERANVVAVNEYRAMMGLHAVKMDERLVRAARKHSIEMQQLEYFDHTSPTKHLASPAQRAQRDGYGGGVSENIARGASTGRQAFEQWFRSSGHHRNMLGPNHTEMGCGAAVHHWWTQLFGSLTGRSLSPPQVPDDPDPPGTSGNGMPPPAPPQGS